MLWAQACVFYSFWLLTVRTGRDEQLCSSHRESKPKATLSRGLRARGPQAHFLPSTLSPWDVSGAPDPVPPAQQPVSWGLSAKSLTLNLLASALSPGGRSSPSGAHQQHLAGCRRGATPGAERVSYLSHSITSLTEPQAICPFM